MQPKKRLLDVIQIASPCPAAWDEMQGDQRARFCAQCKLNVYDLSTMTADEAEAFLQAREGRVCLRLYRRPDGTILTQDCPVGWRLARRKVVGLVTALGAFIGFVVSGLAQSQSREEQDSFVQAGPLRTFEEAVDPKVFTVGMCFIAP